MQTPRPTRTGSDTDGDLDDETSWGAQAYFDAMTETAYWATFAESFEHRKPWVTMIVCVAWGLFCAWATWKLAQ